MTKKILFWFGVCIVSLLVMVRPAAASGTVSFNQSESPVVQYTGNVYTCNQPQTWTTDIVSAAQTAVDGRNCNFPSPPYTACLYNNVSSTTLIVYGDCGNPKTGKTTDSITQVSTRLRCVSSNVNATNGVCPATSCPVNSTLTGGSCICDGTYQPNGGATACVAAVCPAANTLHSSGFFNIGTTASGSALASACQGGCAIKTVGSTATPGQSLYIAAPPKIRQIRNGVWYYFAEMSYYHTGVNCSPDTANFLSDFVGNKPDMTCAAGQQMITMSGVTKCFNSDGSATNANSASAVAAAKTLADQKIASAVAAAGTAAQQAGLGASAVEAAKTAAAAGAIVSTGGTSSNPYSTSDPMFQYCVDNPDADLCQQKTACDKNPNLASCAELGTVADDVPLGTRTVSVTNITPVTVGGAGACPAPRAMVLHGQTYYMAFDTYCNFATGIKPIILVFAWLASAGLLVGGFKAA